MLSVTACCLPFPACRRGAVGESRRMASIKAPHSVETPALSPVPLP
ncbi:protein of unknown function [Cupriavidus taiwanensis]|nr:protein of unknown function [Cupriavidus taiwanensis]